MKKVNIFTIDQKVITPDSPSKELTSTNFWDNILYKSEDMLIVNQKDTTIIIPVRSIVSVHIKEVLDGN